MDHNQQGQGHGRRHSHRGRRGPDRRGPDRRGPQTHAQEQGSRNDVDVEQIMRDIRARIAQRHGIELTPQQIQELAARRLESILDPRGIKPGLLDQLRRAAGAPPESAPRPADPPYSFEDHTLFESPNGFVRFMRKLLAPILALFFDPSPLIRALKIQARVNAEAAARDADRDRRQAEWNALHYELLHRVVTENARLSLEVQSLSLRVESLDGKVDFNERRVRGIEGTVHQARPSGRREEPVAAVSGGPAPEASGGESPQGVSGPATGPGQPSEGTRRRRRRRRGRRGTGTAADGTPIAAGATPLDADVDADTETDADLDVVEQDEAVEDPTTEQVMQVAEQLIEQPVVVEHTVVVEDVIEQATEETVTVEAVPETPADEPLPVVPADRPDTDPTER